MLEKPELSSADVITFRRMRARHEELPGIIVNSACQLVRDK